MRLIDVLRTSFFAGILTTSTLSALADDFSACKEASAKKALGALVDVNLPEYLKAAIENGDCDKFLNANDPRHQKIIDWQNGIRELQRRCPLKCF